MAMLNINNRSARCCSQRLGRPETLIIVPARLIVLRKNADGLLVGIVDRKLHQCQGLIPIVMVWPFVVANHVLDDSFHTFRLTVSLWMERCRKRLSRAHQTMVLLTDLYISL